MPIEREKDGVEMRGNYFIEWGGFIGVLKNNFTI